MLATGNTQQHIQAGTLSVAAAFAAVSLTFVISQGAAANSTALFCVGGLAVALLSGLVYLRPLATFVLALLFMTSPIPLLLTLQQSALVSAFLLAGSLLGFLLRTRLRDVARDPLFLPLGLLAACGLISAAYGLWLGNKLSYVLGDCFQIIEFAAVYFLVIQLLSTRETLRQVLRILLVSMLVTIVVELILFALGPTVGSLLPSWEGNSVSESLVRTIDIDATTLFAVLFNLYPIMRSPNQRFWIWVALVPTLANIALSLSRGLWLCTIVATLVSLLLQRRKASKQLFTAFAIVSICLVMLAGAWKIGADSEGSLLSVLQERIFHGVDQVEEGLAGTESMATRRFLEMAIVGPQVLAKPWIGHGLGATYVIGGFAVLDAGTDAPIDHHFIHNLYLVTAFRMGIVGLVLVLWILFRYFRKILGACKNMPSECDRALVVGFIASIVGQMFLSLTQPTILDHPTCALIACAMALSFKLAAQSSANGQPLNRQRTVDPGNTM